MNPSVNIILAHNGPSSITRLAAMYGNELIRLGWDVTVSYPYVDQYEFLKFQNLRPQVHRLRGAIRYTLDHLRRSPRTWAGKVLHSVDPSVRENPYFCRLSSSSLPPTDHILLFQGQLLEDLARIKRPLGKITTSLHVTDYELNPELGAWYAYVLEHHLKQYDSQVFAVSQSVKDYYEAKGLNVDGVVHNGIDLEEFHPIPFNDKQRAVLVFVNGKRQGQKGEHLAYEIIKVLRTKDPTLQINSIGDTTGIDATAFDQNYGFLSGEPYAAVYREHQYFLYPSLYDGFPAPPLEAMASGCAVITSAVAGVVDYARDCENLMLCGVNQRDEFIEKTLKVLNDQALAERIATRAITDAHSFSWPRCTERLVSFLTGHSYQSFQNLP